MNDFEEIINQIDFRIGEYIRERNWERYIPDTDCEQYKALCRHLLYVITRFLEDTDPQNRELFIAIPFEEFADIGNNELQTNRWRDFVTTIISCLSLATADQLKQNTIGEIGEGDSMLYIYGQNAVGKCVLRDERAYGAAGRAAGQIDNNYSRAIFKTKCRSGFRGLNAGLFMRLIELLNDGGILENLTKNKLTRQYSSAALVSLDIRPSRDITPWDDDWLLSPVSFATKYNDVTGRNHNYDILVVFGDRKYMKSGMTIEQRYRNTNANKIIYIGTKEINTGQSYAFSVRELYHYCYNGNFQRPNTVMLTFGWLNERKEELEALLSECAERDETLTEPVQKRTARKFLCQFQNADFDSEKLTEIKTFWDCERIGDTFADPDTLESTINSVYNWFQNLQFNEINPKREYMNNHPESDSFSRFQAVKRCVRNDNESRSIILDNLGFHERYDDRYSHILRYNVQMNVTALYYEGFEEYSLNCLNRFLDNYLWYTSTPFRESGITRVELNVQQQDARQVEITTGLTLNDFLDDDFLDYEYNENNHPMYARDSINYYVEFTDNTQVNIDGNIVVCGDDGNENRKIGIAELFESGNCRGRSITYYRKPDNLDALISEVTGLSFEEINRYSILWKTRFREHFNSLSAQRINAVEHIHRNCRALSKNLIKIYSTENDRFFIRNKEVMKQLCNYLHKNELITEEESRFIKASRSAFETRKDFGKKLKSEILKLVEYSEYSSDFLNKLLNNHSREDLIQQTTNTKTIRRINRQ